MAVVQTITAGDERSLEQISDWAHDADLLVDRSRLEESTGTAHFAFEQEPLDSELALPERVLVGQSWWSSRYRLPFILCRLRIEGAMSWSGPWDYIGDCPSLLGVRWDAKKPAVLVHTTWGEIAVATGALDVTLEITDEIVSMRNRRVGRIVPFDSTS